MPEDFPETDVEPNYLRDGNVIVDLEYFTYELGPGEIGDFPRLLNLPDEFS
jgi:hypothetical protein